MIWVPPVMKRPQPGAWQRAADEYQAAMLRAYRADMDRRLLETGLFLAESFGERGLPNDLADYALFAVDWNPPGARG